MASSLACDVYSSIGRVIVERGYVPLDELSLERMLGWLARNPLEAREIMRTNRSYIFFREAPELDAADGPIGGAGLPLVAGRSLAVDRNVWSYGLPFWLASITYLVSPSTGAARGHSRWNLRFAGGWRGLLHRR